MTKGIEEMFDLPPLVDFDGHEDDELENDGDGEEISRDNTKIVSRGTGPDYDIDVYNGDGHSRAMDQIHKEMLKAAQNILDYGFNADQRGAATLFEKATMMYKGAIDAKNSKRDMQLKAMKLALDAKKLELDAQKVEIERGKAEMEERKTKAELGEKTTDAEGVIVENRNTLILQMREQMKAGG